MSSADPQPRRKGGAMAFVVALGALMLFALGALVYLGKDAKPTGPEQVSSIGGPFTLTAGDGRRFTLADLGGKPYAIYFGYTRCPDVCPTTLARLARLRKQLGSDGGKFAIVFVSVDPGHDKPADVARYVTAFETPIVALTGTEAELAPVVKAYGIYVQKVPQPGGDYTVDHTAATYLMNGQGQLIDLIDHNDSDPAALAKLRALIG